MMLAELEPRFIAWSPEGPHGGTREVDAMHEADGVIFRCPCGDHYVVCWSPRAPVAAVPGPARWTTTGSSLADLTLSPSIQITSGCRWHGWIQRGEITDVQMRPLR